jgi:hypothetical protein
MATSVPFNNSKHCSKTLLTLKLWLNIVKNKLMINQSIKGHWPQSKLTLNRGSNNKCTSWIKRINKAKILLPNGV